MNFSEYSIFILLAVSSILTNIDSARILCVFPIPSFSHQIVFREYTKELAKHGHELVIITTDPYLPKDRPKDNITEIDVRISYQSFHKMFENFKNRNILVQGVSLEMEMFGDEGFTSLTESLVVDMLKLTSVNQIINDPNQHFDLLVIEGFYEYALVLTEIFKAPTIMITSYYGTPENYDTFGAVKHPVIYPNHFKTRFDSQTLWDKLYAIYKEFVFYNIDKKLELNVNQKLKKNYGQDAPTLNELRNNVDMLFINSHPMFDGNRPVPPNVVYLGSLHLQPVKKLPEDLEKYLNNSKNGVVYVSLGTNVHTKLMDKDLLEVFINALKRLPYDVLWKFDGEISGELNNLKLQRWLPQRDLLTHPKIKLFVTQGGRQSLDEAIDAGVPMVAIPTFADQWYNTKKSVEFGICTSVDIKTMTADVFSGAMLSVIDDVTYKKNVEKLRTLINDQPEKPIDRAIWWTEYLLRNGGAKHLKSPLANISWAEYLMLDVVFAVAATFLIILLILVLIVYYCVTILKKNNILNEKKTK